MLHTHDSTAHPPISKDWDGFDWVKAQYNKKNVDALKAYRELSKSTGGPTAKYGLRINAELRTAGKMSLAGRVLLVSVKTGLHSFEVAEVPSSPKSAAVKAVHHFLINPQNRNEEGHLMVSASGASQVKSPRDRTEELAHVIGPTVESGAVSFNLASTFSGAVSEQ